VRQAERPASQLFEQIIRIGELNKTPIKKKDNEFVANEQGTCPLCGGGDLEYGNTDLDGDGLSYEWECNICGTEGSEWYNLEFTTHGNVRDKNGNEVPSEIEKKLKIGRRH